MLPHLYAHHTFEKLQRDISSASSASDGLVSAVGDLALERCALSDRIHRANRIRELTSAQAWTDAALALVALDHSRVLRHVIHEEGEWRCTLGSFSPLPAWLDDTTEFSHVELPLAILGALVKALRKKTAPVSTANSVPRSRAEPRDLTGYVGCDNFA